MLKNQLLKTVQLLIVLIFCTISAQTVTIDSFTDQVLCTNDPVTYTAEIHKTAYLDFNKADGRYITLNSLQDDLAGTNRSAFMWVKKHTDVAETFQSLFTINSSVGSIISYLRINTNERVAIYHGSNDVQTGSADALDNQWHYVGYTYDNSSTETIIYIDGVAVQTFNNNQATTATDIYSLGQRHYQNLNYDKFFDGYLAEVSIWDDVLTATEIATAMGNKIDNTHPKYLNLVGYYSFPTDGQTTTELKDYSPKGNDGVITGSIINKVDNIEDIPNFNAANWYALSWQKNTIEFSTNTSVNITPDNATDAYKLRFVNPNPTIIYEDVWDLTYAELLPTQPTAATSTVGGSTTFEVDNISGATYQWYKNEENITTKTTTSIQVYGVYEYNGIIYIGTEEGLGISIDNGDNFTFKTMADGLANNKVNDVYVSDGIIYASTEGGISISTDNGANFINKTTANGLGSNRVNEVYKSDGIIYAATEFTLGISTDNGVSFTTRSTFHGFADNSVNGVYASNGVIYAATDGGLSISTDNGVSFNNKTTLEGLGHNIVFGVVESNGIIYAATYDGLSISSDNGLIFSNKTSGLNEFARLLGGVYVSDGIIYVGTFQGGLGISTDNGDNFIRKTQLDGLLWGSVWDVYASNGIVYAADRGGLSIIADRIVLENEADNTADNQIQGATTNTLTINNLTIDENDAEYYVIVSKDGCDQTSNTVALTVSQGLVNWTGGTNTDWSTAANWDTNTVPTATDDVVIPSDGNNQLIIAANTTALSKDLTIETSGSLTLATGAALTVNGNFSSADANALVGNSGSSIIVTGTATGVILYKRNLPNTNWYLIASPVKGETVKDFLTAHTFLDGSGTTPSKNIAFANYKNNGSSWNYYVDGDFDGLNDDDTQDLMEEGEGYSMKLASPDEISFSGTINTSSITSQVLTQATSNLNLIGNPFTAYVNLGDFFASNGVPSVLSESTGWFWDGSTYQTKTGNIDGAFEITPVQAFFVSAGAASVQTTFDYSKVSHQTTDVFQKSSDTRPQIKLFMSDGKNTRYTRLFYLDGTTTGFDNGYDGTIFGGASQSFALYTHLVANSQGQKLGVQALPPNNYENMVIPIGVNTLNVDEISFTTETLNLPSGINVFIEDKQAKTFTQIDQTNSKYTIKLTQDLNDIGRFYLHTSSSVLNVTSNNLENVSMYTSDKATLRIVGLTEGKTQVKLFSVLGKQVMSTSFQSKGVKDISITNLAAGIYIVELQTKKGTLNKKIILE